MKKRKDNPEISTASLPDIIFMLLFFFMVVTVLRKDPSKLYYDIPETNHNTKINQSKDAAYVFIGKNFENSKTYSIQINDRYVALNELEKTFRILVSNPEVDISSFEITLKADKSTPMKLIRTVKLAMQKAGIKHLYYLSEKRA